jgi:hypothetical protein
MPSAPHVFGISGKAGSGRRVNSDSGCRLDCEFGKPISAAESWLSWLVHWHADINLLYDFDSDELLIYYASISRSLSVGVRYKYRVKVK